MEISLNGSDWKLKGFWPVVGRRSGWQQDSANWQNATVPGCVQRDLINLGEIADPYVDFNSRDAEWVSNKDWVYVKKFTAPKDFDGKRCRIRLEGVDYFADYFLNGERIGESGNLFLPVEFDVTEKLEYGKENTLIVALHPAPPEQAQMGWTSKVWTMKPRFCYQWDFSTALVPIGIWQGVKLLANESVRITDVWARGIPSSNLTRGEARIEVEVDAAIETETVAEVEVLFGGKSVGKTGCRSFLDEGSNKVKLSVPVPNVRLWWPNGSGEQNVYQARIRLLDNSGKVMDERQVDFGFKQVKLLPNPGAPAEVAPFSLEVNGRCTYIKGWNWVPIDHMYGGDHSAKYKRLLKLAKEANVNLIRIWGGGLIEQEDFYRLCDEYGLMVWQEFTLSSSAMESFPSTKPEYVNMLRDAAKEIVPLRRNHPSLTIWCGGNELTWVGKEDLAMRTLHSVCSKLDPDKPFVATSPLSSDSDKTPEKDTHGGWQYFGLEPHYKHYNGLKTVIHSEFGAEGAANLESIPRFIKDAELWPPSKTEGIWPHRGEWWVNYSNLCTYFGDIPDLATLVRLSQFIQWEGLRYIVEANRRRKHGCGGSIPWQYNEPWPNLSCTNSVDWYGTPKMAYYAVAEAYAPVHVSAKYDKLAWQPGETFTAELWVNNSTESMMGCSVEVTITSLCGDRLVQAELGVDCPGNAATRAGAVEFKIPKGLENVFILTAVVRDNAGTIRSENVYVFTSAPEPALSPLTSLPETKIKVTASDNGDGRQVVKVANKGSAYAMFVRLRPKDLDADVYFSSNYLVIPPGEYREVSVSLDSGSGELICGGWNTNSEEVG